MATSVSSSQHVPSVLLLGGQSNGTIENNGALKALLAEPVEFREFAQPTGADAAIIDPKGKGWIEVNPLPVANSSNGNATASTSKLPSLPSTSSVTRPHNPKSLYQGIVQLGFVPGSRPIGPGFNNVGNTCYLNSVLQCVIHTPGLGPLLFEHEPAQCPVKRNPKSDGFCVACSLKAVYQYSFLRPNQGSYNPSVITKNLKKIARHLRLGRQEDSHEFLRFLVDGLQNAALAPHGEPNKIPAELKYTTSVHQLFGGRLRSRVTCHKCHHNSDTFDAFLDLSVEVKNCGSVRNAFERFIKPDRLDGNNKYKCEKCKTLVVASKQLTIQSTPKALVVHLKRFTPMGGKIGEMIQYDKSLDLGPYMSKGESGARYKLYGVVCHSGSGPHSGHYTARVLSTDGSSWHNMDDSYVSSIGKPPLGLRDAYVLFYVREKGDALLQTINSTSAGGPSKKRKVELGQRALEKEDTEKSIEKDSSDEDEDEDQSDGSEEVPKPISASPKINGVLINGNGNGHGQGKKHNRHSSDSGSFPASARPSFVGGPNENGHPVIFTMAEMDPALVSSDSSPILSDEFRSIYVHLIPSVIVLFVVPLLLSFPRILPRFAYHYLITLPLEYVGRDLTLQELYPDQPNKRGVPIWKAAILATGGLAFALVYGCRAGWKALSGLDGGAFWVDIVLGCCWLYAATYPILRPRPTPYPTIVVFHALQLIASLLTLLTALFKLSILPPVPHEPVIARSTEILTALSATLSAVLVAVSLSLPVESVPASYEEERKAEANQTGGMGSSPEDGCSVWDWITFNWVKPLIKRGSSGYLKDDDVYMLSPTQRSQPLYAKFKTIRGSSLLQRLLKAHGFDLLLDLLLTFLSIMLNYAAPFFIKRIIEALAAPTPKKLSSAYVYATLALIATILKAQSDLNHLWFSRRASVRIKNQLASAIYEKALKRKDKSGVSESKGSAGTGKIVNLMSGDTNRIGNAISGLYMLYGAPFEIVVCCAFLYSMLSWSAFAGMFVLVAVMPLNTIISKRNVEINKALLAARDKRLNVMNELIGAIKFIKFFAWEKQWTKRVTDIRQEELNVMVRDRVNSIYFTILWNVTPMLVTIISFLSFIKLEKGELTIGVAFTSLSLFSMLRGPLNIIPMFVVSLLQTHVAIKRIDDFLQEEEVPDFVSSLKMAENPNLRDPKDEKIGFIGGTFRWTTGDTTVSDASKTASAAPATASAASTPPTSDSSTVVATLESTAAENELVRFELTDLSFVFPTGQLTVITGSTGAGKSALLYALLGEMEIIKGNVLLPKDTATVDKYGLTNSVSYAGQTAWLQNMSIKDNILFGSPLDEKRYADVVQACCLVPDLKMLEDGDSTEIGAKGVSLSGGQKARVALARAIYSRAKHVLLDDPLAAVDSHTAASLVTDCLAGPLCANRTVIIVSHHVELLLPIANSLVRIVDGRIEAQGTIDELRAAGHLAAIIATEKTEVLDEAAVVSDAETAEKPTDAAEVDETTNKTAEPKKDARKMVKDEEREVGNVQWKTYKVYFEASSYKIWAVNIALLLVAANAAIIERWWIKEWTNAYSDSPKRPHSEFVASHHVSAVDHPSAFSNGYEIHTSQSSFYLPAGLNMSASQSIAYGALTALARPSADSHPLYYLGIYSMITLATAALSVLQATVGYYGAYRASKILHNEMLKSVVRSTTRWFDTTPSGRIVNRFSRDQETIDTQLAQSLRVVASYSLSLVGALFLVASIVPPFLLPAAFLSYAYWRLSVAYIRCGRDLRRMEATARSPIFSGFSETLEGVVTIRAFSSEIRFMEGLQSQFDKSQSCFYFIWMLNRWLLVRFDCLGGLSVFVTSLLALGRGVSGGWGGMAILSSQGFVQAVYWLCRFWSQLEMDLNSVERVEEYLHLPQESPAVIESNRPPAYWPSHSSETLIHVEDLVISYAPELPSVIHGISFDIKPREKVGLIGRTGSGKPTLGMSLLRFSEPTSGKIVIDGIDIASIGLEDLRSRITIIPQDAVLFSGTIRENLDPFKEHDDSALLDALERVQLGNTKSVAPSRVPSNSNLVKLGQGKGKEGDEEAAKANSIVSNTVRAKITLDTEVSAGGANFSQGQRQLLAMCRALLRNSSIIIMDEATASVDFETDTILQKTIREEFKDSCLITIAHRLSSVIDYDRLLVLDHGHLKEFASPYELLQKPAGEDAIFRGMCEKSGRFDELLAAATEKHEREE
ncbi:multidrug resistance-associated abc transporter [Phaffia rhodozyma]|uniref:Multidrug resistance-associated abc transporter n=1 Tax=Phaffia rhodozyma TaxID=264483 RepID=A0A0F7SNI4_PHARH|nr:multidrug resistance-associated abc transporter [Phaffia rhodozyma]